MRYLRLRRACKILTGNLSAGGFPTSGCQAALEALASTGASEVAITELDIGGGTSEDWVNVSRRLIPNFDCAKKEKYRSSMRAWMSRNASALPSGVFLTR